MEGVEKGDGGTVSNSRENDSSVSVQAVNIDFYNESADTADELNHQYPHPVIRLYGSLRDGTRACVHIHGVQKNEVSKYSFWSTLTSVHVIIKLGFSISIFPTGGYE